jgi:hypothetical protein
MGVEMDTNGRESFGGDFESVSALDKVRECKHICL